MDFGYKQLKAHQIIFSSKVYGKEKWTILSFLEKQWQLFVNKLYYWVYDFYISTFEYLKMEGARKIKRHYFDVITVRFVWIELKNQNQTKLIWFIIFENNCPGRVISKPNQTGSNLMLRSLVWFPPNQVTPLFQIVTGIHLLFLTSWGNIQVLCYVWLT